MNKFSIKLIIIAVALLLILSLSACNDTDSVLQPTLIIPIHEEDEPPIDSNRLSGIVRDINYQPISNIDIFFGENNEFVQKTNSNGEFDFDFVDPYKLMPENQLDYFTLDREIYNFKVFIKSFNCMNSDFGNYHTSVFVVVTNKENSINLNEDILVHEINKNREDIFFDIRIASEGIRLPEGYLNREVPVPAGTVTSKSEHALIGVKVYVNEQYIMDSDSFGIGFDFLTKGATLSLEYEGFTFGIGIGLEELNDSEDEISWIIEPAIDGKTFIINALPNIGSKIFAYTDNTEILIEQYGEKYE